MNDEADAAREYDRLRAELADFVLDALSERMARGDQPHLSEALAKAIDRRVDEAVSARVDRTDWPDPDRFADAVIAAAAGRGGGTDGAAAYRGGGRDGSASSGSRRRMDGRQIALLVLLGIALLAAATFFFLRSLNQPNTNTVVMNVQTNTLEPTPDGAANALQPPPEGGEAPNAAGAIQNQGQPR